MSIAATIKTLQDYLEELSRQHVDVQHEVDGKTAFVRLESHAQVSGLRTKAGANLVVVLGCPGRAAGAQDPDRIKRDLVLRFASYATGTDPVMARSAAVLLSESIMFDFIAKLREDYLLDPVCGPLKELDLNNLLFEEMEDQPWFVNHFGWDLVIPFRTWYPKYNAAKWQ